MIGYYLTTNNYVTLFKKQYKTNELNCVYTEKYTDETEVTTTQNLTFAFDNNKIVANANSLSSIIYSDKDSYVTMKNLMNQQQNTDWEIIFNDNEKSITTKMDWNQIKTISIDSETGIANELPSEYEKLKDYYLNRGFMCNGIKSTQIDATSVFDSVHVYPAIIYNDKIYFLDRYNENSLSVADLSGKNKKDLKVKNIENIFFVLGDYLYYKLTDDKTYKSTYYKMNINNYNQKISLGEYLVMDKKELQKINYDRHKITTLNRRRRYSNEEYYDILPAFYDDKVIETTEISYVDDGDVVPYQIYLGNTVIYSNENLMSYPAVNGKYLYFVQSKDSYNNIQIVKFDLTNNKVVNTLDVPQKMSIKAYDYNENGVVYLTNHEVLYGDVYPTSDKVYKLDYKKFTLKQIVDVTPQIKSNTATGRNINYIGNKIVYSVFATDQYSVVYNIFAYDEESKKTDKYEENNYFQFSKNIMYIVKDGGQINKIKMD
jgi:hypothetical protein